MISVLAFFLRTLRLINTKTESSDELASWVCSFLPLATLIMLGLAVAVSCGCNGLDEADANASSQGDSAEVSKMVSSNPKSNLSEATANLFEIDGQFDEWKPSYLIATDPSGDSTGAFDVGELMAAVQGDHLYVNFSVEDGAKSTLQNGMETDGTLQLVFFEGEKKMSLQFRDRTFVTNNQVLEWRDFDFRCLPTFASNRYELRVKLDEWDLTNVSIDFAGSDQLDKPVKVTAMVDAVHDSKSLDLGKAKAAFRITNLNTLENGLANNSRSASQHRLLAAANADIYTFQEEWNESKFSMAVPVLADKLGANLQNHWYGGCAIVSRFPLKPVPMDLDRAAAGLVEIDVGKHVVVISVHLKSAGYVGSREDSLRVQQAGQLVGEIKRMRSGEFGEEAKTAAVIVVGDYNLVGSSLPLEVMRGAGLKDVLFKDPKTGDAMTWQGEERTNFWPGRLDWLCHGQELVPSKSLILNSGTLLESELQQIGVEKADSLASDHLMLIGDFEFRE